MDTPPEITDRSNATTTTPLDRRWQSGDGLPRTPRPPVTRLQFLGYLNCRPLHVMIALILLETLLAALTTWFMIEVGI